MSERQGAGISSHPLFRGVSADTVQRLLAESPALNAPKGKILIHQGEPCEHVYLLLEGKVEVYTESTAGARCTILFHEAPQLFGEMEIWTERECLASVITLEPCRLIKLSRADFFRLLHSNHQISINLNQLLCDLLWVSARNRRVELFGRVEHLLANTLCSLAQLYGETRSTGGVLIRKSLHKSELAESLGASRMSVIRAVAALEKEHLVEMDGDQLFIPDLAALRSKAQSILGLRPLAE